MNFKQIETSLDSRQPVRLYEFSRGVFRWLYNSSAINITVNNMIFKSLLGGIADNGIIRSDGGESNKIVITAPSDIEVAGLFIDVAPSQPIVLKMYNSHLGLDTATQVWQGEVVTVNFSASNQVKITAMPTEAVANRLGATQTYSRPCNAVLYDKRCKVNKEQYKKTGSIMQLDLTRIQVINAAHLPDGWFTGGYIEYAIGNGELDTRAIESHTGDSFNLLGGTAGLSVGMAISFYPGCNLTSDCLNKFNNLLNMRATPYLKDKSLFNGDPVGW